MKTLAVISFILGLIMVTLNIAPSWSQYAGTLEEPLLLSCLFCISYAFSTRSQIALNKDLKVLKNVQVRHVDFITGILFGFVLVFSVNHSEKWVNILHFIFTGLAIITAYTNLVLQQIYKLMKISTIISFVIVFILFNLGFIFKLYTTGIAEVIAAFPLLIHFLTTKTEKL